MSVIPSWVTTVDQYREYIKTIVMEWPRGCTDGKEEFLEAIGIELTQHFDGTINIHIEVPVCFNYQADTDLNDVAAEIGDAIIGDMSTYFHYDDDICDVDITGATLVRADYSEG